MTSTVTNTDELAGFVRQLWEAGQVAVRDVVGKTFSAETLEQGWLQLQVNASEERAALSGLPPGVSRPAAEWALLQLYCAASFLIHRTHSEAELRAELDRPLPEPQSPGVCYSVDLTFRYLPDLHRLAKGVSANDPLVAILEDWARQWPLSSVGIELGPASVPAAHDLERPFHGVESLSDWWQNDCLRMLYLDRVMQRGDLSRLHNPAVQAAVSAALGMHPELAPKLAAAMGVAATQTFSL